MICCVSQSTTMGATFLEDLVSYSRAGCPDIELWLPKLEEQLKTADLDALKQSIAEHQVAFPVAALQGGLFSPVEAMRREAWGLFEQRLSLLAALGVETFVISLDFAGEWASEHVRDVVSLLREAAEKAAAKRIRLAVEFQGRAAFCNNVESTVALISEVDRPNVGICLDMFHFICGPSKPQDLALLTTENLFHVQLSDLAGVLRELARDTDRILPGEGDYDPMPLVNRLRDIGYQGTVSVELFNPVLWNIDPLQVVDAAITSLRKVLGLASM